MLVFFFLLICTANYGQTYFNQDWVEVPDKSQAMYVRMAKPVGSQFNVTDFYVSTGAKYMEAICTAVKPKLIPEGKVSYYYDSGVLMGEGNYSNGERKGIFRMYYENKLPHSEILYGGKADLYCQYWSEEGKQMLTNGSGIILHSITPNSRTYKQVKDSLLFSYYEVRTEQKDTLFLKWDEPATYKKGQDALYRKVAQMVRYPVVARTSGVQGKVFVEFIVDKYGEAKEFAILRGVSKECDEEAMRVARALGQWNPGRFNGRPVASKIVFPISFLLGSR